jgi:hypothetical protein
MNNKYGIILFLAMTFTIMGLQGPAEVLACHTNCPEVVEPLPDPIQGHFMFTYKLDPYTYGYHESVAIQVDKSIDCISDNNGRCSNIRVELFGDSLPYQKKSKRFVNNTGCGGDLNFKPGPARSYFLVVPIPKGLNTGVDGLEFQDSEEISSIPLNVFIETTKKLSWGPGNFVIKNTEGSCKTCSSFIPVVNVEISTAVQFIQLGPCKARVRFADNKPLPFKQNDLICPEGVDPPTVSDVIPNEKVLLTVDTGPLSNDEDGYSLQSTNNQSLPFNEPLTFVNEPVLGQVPVAFKTNFDSTYWLYIPGFGWILVTY